MSGTVQQPVGITRAGSTFHYRAEGESTPSLAATGSTLSSIRNCSSSVGSYSFIRATTAAFACSGSDQSALDTESTNSSM
jgi:hypothetical protein